MVRGASIEPIHPGFADCVEAAAEVQRLWSGGRWLEGPAWIARDQRLVWSDVPSNRMWCWDASGGVRLFRFPSMGANGNTTDREGRLVTCEQDARRLTRTETDGSVSVLVDRYEGKRFTAPNDVVVKSDGTIWFSDPDYGSTRRYPYAVELDGCQVYRFNPATGDVRQMTADMVMPNGLAFSPDETLLYVVDTGSTHLPNGPNHIRRFLVAPDGSLSGGDVVAESAEQMFDGLRVDLQGRLWCGAGDGVHCLSVDGILLGKIRLPERAANLTFGGETGDELFIAASRSIYRVPVLTTGAVALR